MYDQIQTKTSNMKDAKESNCLPRTVYIRVRQPIITHLKLSKYISRNFPTN